MKEPSVEAFYLFKCVYGLRAAPSLFSPDSYSLCGPTPSPTSSQRGGRECWNPNGRPATGQPSLGNVQTRHPRSRRCRWCHDFLAESVSWQEHNRTCTERQPDLPPGPSSGTRHASPEAPSAGEPETSHTVSLDDTLALDETLVRSPLLELSTTLGGLAWMMLLVTRLKHVFTRLH